MKLLGACLMAARRVAGGLAGKPINDLQDDVDSRMIYILITTRNNPQVPPAATRALCCMLAVLERRQSRSAGFDCLPSASRLGSLLAAAADLCFRCLPVGLLGVFGAVCTLLKPFRWVLLWRFARPHTKHCVRAGRSSRPGDQGWLLSGSPEDA